jgi:lipoprotein-anchoring transpeptidase ErfK/SrfK
VQSTSNSGAIHSAAETVGQAPPTAEPTWSGLLSLEIVADTPTPGIPASKTAPNSSIPTVDVSAMNGEHWIDVDLSQQMVFAHVGDTVVNSFLASTGTATTPTVTGQYHIYVKLRYTDMTGPDYYLPDVPYTMYFYKDYGLHGTYWHHNFGTPMSHGCVNLSIPDAQWLYDFASVGTLVDVHY